jgi:hypothetical protein
MARQLARITAEVILKSGWRSGTDLENRVAFRLSRYGFVPAAAQPGKPIRGQDVEWVHQQYRVDPYRLDFAWPKLKIALEADGWHHRSPEGAAKDARRDAILREAGWLMFRVHDCDDMLIAEQLSRVARVIRSLIVSGDGR